MDSRRGPASPLRNRFEDEVDQLLNSQDVTDTLVVTNVDADVVRRAAKNRWAQAHRALDGWTRGFDRARIDVDTAQEQLSSFRPSKKSVLAGKIGWVLGIGGLAACIVLAIASTPVWLFMLTFAAVPLALISLPGEERDKYRAELRIDALIRRRDATEQLLHEAVRLHAATTVRETLNAQITCFDTAFRMFDSRGLEQFADAEREIPTQASKRLMRLMASLSSGSIGLSGARGSGKTTLIQSFVAGESAVPMERIRHGFAVSAPVRYDAREFVLHLFTRLCEEVLGDKGLAEMRRRWEFERGARGRQVLIWLLFIVGAFLIAAGVVKFLFNGEVLTGARQTGLLYMSVGSLLAYGAIFLILYSRRAAHRSAKNLHTPERMAEEHFKEIRYQQSIASGWSGGIKLPLGISFGEDAVSTLARSPMTLPEVIDRFRKYAASLSDENYWVIGIDELDKMESEEAARRFLNDIKGVFGVPRCYYLVSVSEDAMSSFERRGMPFRDVFDSSFDAIERVGLLSFAEAQDMLERRVVGFPVPFQMLCQCLSGGLARDLIRAARELVHEDRRLTEMRTNREPADEEHPSTLEDLCRAVVEAELEGIVSAALIATRAAVPAFDREWLLSWLRETSAREAHPVALRERCARLIAWPGLFRGVQDISDDTQTTCSIALQLAVFSYYAATLLEYFTNDLNQSAVEHVIQGDSPIVEKLARARQDMALSARLAWQSVSAFRNGVPNLAPWDEVPTRKS